MSVGIAGALFWLANQWFVGVFSQTGEVATFQGIPSAGLYRVIDVADIKVTELPNFERTQVEKTIDATTYSEATQILNNLKSLVTNCKLNPQTPGCPG
jgi:hypothetical protein